MIDDIRQEPHTYRTEKTIAVVRGAEFLFFAVQRTQKMQLLELRMIRIMKMLSISSENIMRSLNFHHT